MPTVMCKPCIIIVNGRHLPSISAIVCAPMAKTCCAYPVDAPLKTVARVPVSCVNHFKFNEDWTGTRHTGHVGATVAKTLSTHVRQKDAWRHGNKQVSRFAAMHRQH